MVHIVGGSGGGGVATPHVDATARALAVVVTGEAGETVAPTKQVFTDGAMWENPNTIASAVSLVIPAPATEANMLATGFVRAGSENHLVDADGSAASVAIAAAGHVAASGASPLVVFNTASKAEAGVYYAYENPATVFTWTLSNFATANADGVTITGAGTLAAPFVAAATAQHLHTQSVPSTSWAVNHNLAGSVDTVTVYVAGQRVYADYTLVDSNNLIITFPTAQTGVANIEL